MRMRTHTRQGSATNDCGPAAQSCNFDLMLQARLFPNGHADARDYNSPSQTVSIRGGTVGHSFLGAVVRPQIHSVMAMPVQSIIFSSFAMHGLIHGVPW